ncbi:MAG TPA: rod shape-determining protein MreC [Candidatus Limnocylindrales bacterium]|jgi:rod shape-determining protein MreC|nr:rod shape-determining protein MreC [Candidatus Limnocylindrales bacterium]
MSALLASKSARRKGAAYVALLVTSLILLTISPNPLVRDIQHGVAFAFRPVQLAVDGLAKNIGSIASTIAEIDQLRQENAALKSENQTLEELARQAQELRRENELLTGLLQLRNGLEFETRPVSVIARESSEARRAIVIDRGSEDGIKVGQVVISTGGALVGRVTDVGSNFAHVVLISDTSSTVIGQLSTSINTGKVVGQLGTLLMTDVNAAAVIQNGEEVYTAGIELGSGIRSPYPKGLLIGRVIDVTRDPNEVVQTVFLDPAAPLDRLEFLLVITDYEGGIVGPIETGVPCTTTGGGTLPDSDQPCASGGPSAVPASTRKP